MKNKFKLIISSVIILIPILVGVILWNSLPEQKYEITKSSSERVNAIMKPVRTPGMMFGSSTFRKDCIGVQPRSSAASGRWRSIWRNLGATLSRT